MANKSANQFSWRKIYTKPSVFQAVRSLCIFSRWSDGKLTQTIKQSGPDSGRVTFKALIGFGLLCICTVQLPCWADSRAIQSIDSIRNTVADFLQASLPVSTTSASQKNTDNTVSVGKLDPRLTLDHCQIPLKAFLPAGSRLYGKTTVGVRCDGHKPWTVYVPANIVTVGKYLVAKGSLQRGQILSLEDVEYAQKDTSILPRNHLTEADSVVGMELKHQLSPGRTVTADMLTRPDTIKKGQQVTVYSRSGGLLVSSVGVAMANGVEGARVKVKNPSSRRVIEGIVRADGNVDTSR